MKALSASEIELGWHQTFSTSNPFCPCDLGSFTKAVRWAEQTVPRPRNEDQMRQLAEANFRVGSWLSAALEDASVCEEFKDDIRAWMEIAPIREPDSESCA